MQGDNEKFMDTILVRSMPFFIDLYSMVGTLRIDKNLYRMEQSECQILKGLLFSKLNVLSVPPCIICQISNVVSQLESLGYIYGKN